MAFRARTKIKKDGRAALRKLNKLNSRFKGPDTVKVGLPKGSNNYPDGTSVIMVGAVHEFGSASRGVPQRSFLRATVQGNRRKYKTLFRKLSKRIVSGSLNKEQALRMIGLAVYGDVIARISAGISPSLKARSGTPLRDTGHLIQSVTFIVGDN